MKHLLFAQWRIIRNKVRTLTLFDQAKLGIFLFIGAVFLLAIYAGTWRLLAYLNTVALVGHLLINKLLAMVFLTSFSMVVFSSLITSFTTIFSSRDLNWLMATPVPVRDIFTFKSLNTAVYASWMVIVALLPFLIALGQVKEVSWSFYALVAAMLVPFLLLASLAGIFLSLLLMRFFPYHRTRDILLLLGVLFMTGVYVLFRFLSPERLVKPDGLEVVSQYLAYLDAPMAVYLPSWWLTGGIYSLLARSSADFIFYFSLLCGTSVVAMLLVIGFAEKFFFIGWAEGKILHRRSSAAPSPFRGRTPFRALLQKDLTVFFRDANQWSQILLLAALAIVYLFSIYKLPLETMYLQNIVTFFNVGLIGFIMSAVALRFVYPSISLEGETLWLLRVSPVSIAQVVKEKFIFGSIPVALMGAVLVVASNLLIGTDGTVVWISLAAVVLMALGLNALAIGFGSFFPVFRSTSIAQIESSPGGIFYIVTAFFYLGLTIALWAAPLRNFYIGKFGGTALPWHDFWWVLAAVLALNTLAVVASFTLGIKSLEANEQ